MTGFGKPQNEERFGARYGKPGEWYMYTLIGETEHHYGRYKTTDQNDFVYFDQAPYMMLDDTGARYIIKDGEIGIQLQQFKTFFPTTIKEVEQYLETCNLHREYLDTWVFIRGANTAIAIGKPRKIFPHKFHLLPYVSLLNQPQIITEGKEQVVFITPQCSLEAITEEMLNKYLDSFKAEKRRN
ncbi:MAG: hypothetical protein QXR48_03250 [Candidatus Woesearchaeota archaeon]